MQQLLLLLPSTIDRSPTARAGEKKNKKSELMLMRRATASV